MPKMPIEYVRKEDFPDDLHEYIDKWGIGLFIELFEGLQGSHLYFRSVLNTPAVIKRYLEDNNSCTCQEISKIFNISLRQAYILKKELTD